MYQVTTGVSAAALQATLNELPRAVQLVQVVYDTGTSSYTIIAQKNPSI